MTTDIRAYTNAPGISPQRLLAVFLMVVSSVVISFGGLVQRSIEAADAWQINVHRSLAFIIAVFIILLIQCRRDTVRELYSIGYAGVWAGVILAVAGLAFMQALFNTTIANTMFTLSAIPFITAILARVFLRETLTSITLVAMVTAALGVIVMQLDSVGEAGSTYGNMMALITAGSFSTFAVIVRSNRHVNMLPALLLSGLFIVVVAVIQSIDRLGVSLYDLMLCFVWGGLMSGVGNGLFIFASRHLVAAELTLFMLLEFALSPIWVWLFIGEVPTRWALFGGVVIIGSVVLKTVYELSVGSRPIRRGRPSPG